MNFYNIVNYYYIALYPQKNSRNPNRYSSANQIKLEISQDQKHLESIQARKKVRATSSQT